MGWVGSSRTPLVAGGAGLVCGALLAATLGLVDAREASGISSADAAHEAGDRAVDSAREARREPAAPGPPDEEELARQEEVRARAVAVATAVAAIEGAHGRLHVPKEAEAVTGALSDALKSTFASDKERRRLLERLYEAIGHGRFVRGGRLTSLGAAVVTRVGELERHGVEVEGYPREELAAIAERRAVEELDTEALAGGARRVLRELLEEATFDPLRATRRLESLDAVPGAEDVAAVADDLVRRGIVGATRPADVADDVRLAATFVQLVLDFRFVKKVGPFELRKADTVLARPKDAARLFETLVKIADGDGEGEGDPLAALDPPHPQYAAMLSIHDRYRAYAEEGCETLPASWKVRPGMKGAEVERVQRRLACEGYYDGPIDGVHEGAALAAARTYQRHHELPAEGFVAEETIKSMNVSMERRAAQIALTLQRMRESQVDEMGDPFIRVNVPAFELTYYEDGKVLRRQRVIVGTNRLDDDKKQLIQGHLNRTKLFTTNLYEIVVNPTWILPARVEHGELKGQIARDPDYLEKNNIRRITLKSGKQVYIQGMGDGNVLGKVKFLLERSNAIYLHDTDKRNLFKERRRDFSHGCIRVDGAIAFAKWLLERDGFTEVEIERAFRLTEVQRGFKLKKPLDLITEYMTVDISHEGLPVFLTDVYGYDRAVEQGNLPPQVTTRWGAVQLRPRWVPRVSEETVARWRAEGKAAPRDYDPEVHGP